MRVNEEKISNRRKQRKNQKIRKVILTVLLALGAVIIAGAAYAWSRISKAEDAIHQKVETVQLREKELTDDSSFSVLLLGIDNGAYGRDTEVGRSDTMLLVTVNPKLKKTTMINPEIILIIFFLSSSLFLKKSGSVIESPAISVKTRSLGATTK